jgi:hypothetical protein
LAVAVDVEQENVEQVGVDGTEGAEAPTTLPEVPGPTSQEAGEFPVSRTGDHNRCSPRDTFALEGPHCPEVPFVHTEIKAQAGSIGADVHLSAFREARF